MAEYKDNNLSLQLKQDSIFDAILDHFGNDVNAAIKFRNTLLSMALSNDKLKICTAQSILSAAFEAVDLGLSVNPKLGQAYVVPYKDSASLQIGYRGYLLLAERSGLLKDINTLTIYEGMIAYRNPLTDEITFADPKSDAIIGFLAYFELTNGFKKFLYWDINKMKNHYSKHAKAKTAWSSNFESMAQKTILQHLLYKWFPFSIDYHRITGADPNDEEDLHYDENEIENFD